MNWPDIEDVECVGFNSALLPILIEAWENGRVDRHVGAIRRSSTDFSWTFDYLGFQYQIDFEQGSKTFPDGSFGTHSTPYRLSKIAKVDVDDDGNTVIVESYPCVPQQPKAQPRPESWGTF